MTLVVVGLTVLVALGLVAARSVASAQSVSGSQARRRRLGRSETLAASVIAILVLTLLPVGGPNEIQLSPFSHPSVYNAVANVLLFAPLGAVLSLRRWPHRRATLAGLALAAAIELAQLAVAGRTTSTADVIWNTLGTAAGWALATAAWRAIAARRDGAAG
jgi:glycopeptide antibiotics resistance protein